MVVGSTLSAFSIFCAAAVVTARTRVSDVEWESFRLLNELRAKGFTCPSGATYGPNSTPLLFDCRLWRASYLHSEDMAKKNYFSHTSLDGRSPWDRAKAQSNGAFIANAENIAINSATDAAGAMNAWKGSDGHCRNMMNASRTSMGVGSYERHWTQMLGGQNTNQVDKSCYPSGGNAPTANPTPPPTPMPVTSGNGGGNNGGGNVGVPTGLDGKPLTGPFEPTRCAIADAAKGQKCAQCMVSAQCKAAYGQNWYCCPYMKKCVNSGGMSCFTPTARCNPRCWGNTFADVKQCTGCNWDLNTWVQGCSKAEWEAWNAPRETPVPTEAPTPSPAGSPPAGDKFSSLAEFKVYCEKLGDDKDACSACGGKFLARKGTCKLATAAKKVKCKKVKDEEVCSKLGCVIKNSKCKGKPKSII